MGLIIEKKYFVGIDGGGTKSTVCVICSSGELISTFEIEPTNYTDAKKRQICDVLLELKSTLKETFSPIEMWSICLSGLGRMADQVEFKKVLDANNLSEKIFVEGDALAALEGAIPDEQGIILIAGTGSIAFGKSETGHVFRAGGWGYLLGDEGSGFSIGKKGLNAALQDFDGRGIQTALRAKFEKFFAVDSIEKSITHIYTSYSNRGDLAKFAPFVFEEAKNGDEVAKSIVLQAAQDLAELVIAVCKKIENEGSTKLALIGNLFKETEILKPAFVQFLQNEDCKVELAEGQFPPEIGAVLLGLKHFNIEHSQIIASLKKKNV